MRNTLFKIFALGAALAAAPLVLLSAPALAGQQKAAAPAAKVDEKAEAIIKRAIDAVGGPAYLGARTQVSRGFYTPFRDGAQGLPIRFDDYIVFPDRERTEFRGSGVRNVQTNTGETGWLFEGQSRKLTDVTPEQAENFRVSLRTSIDNALRGWWRAEGASLAYVGRREAGLAKRNEVVKISYPDGFEVEFEFDAKDALPNKARFKRKNKEGEMVEEEFRFAQYLPAGAARLPFVVDHYEAGAQTSRVNYEAIDLNREVPASFFEKPTDIKAFLKSLK
ncbi:MAG TPA: hypothetical protein VD968_05760 [Pyrinomonadaceae bacterium]|nr:hypothetical protein [Pyrinomonadaceae bacterium]